MILKEKDLKKLETILKKSKAVSEKEIYQLLSWSKKKQFENKNVIENWIENGYLIKNSKNKFNLTTNLGYIRGTFSNIKNKFGFVDTETDSYFIPKNKFNHALDGDIVLINVLKNSSGNKKEGEIIRILKREKDKIIGVFEKLNNFGFVRAFESFGKDIYIPKHFFNNAEDGNLVSVEITFWGDSKRKPEGKIISVLGNPSNSNTLIEGLLIRENISETFPDDVLAEARQIPITIPTSEYSTRVDLRNLSIITIDGADAKDLDDAVYLEKLENGNFKLIVSIADVSYYIKEGSKLDKEAELRGNSIYLVDRVLPMFPKEISNGICSLNPNEDKLTFSVELILTPSGKIVDSKTYKSIIKTVHRMTYDNVNKILENEDDNIINQYLDIKDMLFNMLSLSKTIRKIKYDRGAIDFNLPEIKVVLDENKKVKYLKNVNRGEAERIIEDFMILANEAVAEKLFWLEIPSVYRIHEIPDSEKIKDLNTTLSRFGYRLHSFEDIHPKKFQSIIEKSEKDGVNLIVHKMILRSLKQAKYSMENLGHFGLASSYYTHFTSPIRRYSDLLVHRILDLSSKGYPTKKQFGMLLKYLPEVTKHISETERKAMKIEEESIKIKVTEYMLDKVGEQFSATIIGFSNTKVFFETDEHIECYWDVISSKGFYEFDDILYIMMNIDTGKVFKLGDKLDVIVARVSLQELEIEVVPADIN